MSKYKTIYRVVENKDYNEFNAEMQYTILTYDYDEAKNKIRRRGWNSWHGLKGEQIFHSRTMAEKWLCELNYNYFFNKSAQADKIKWQDQQITELQAKLNEYEIKFKKHSDATANAQIKMYDEQLKNKDLQARVAELENMNNKLCQGIYWGNGEQFCDRVKRLEKEIKQLQQRLEDLKKVAIVPKFKIGQKVVKGMNYKPYKTEIKNIRIYEDYQIFYETSNSGIVQESCLFATEEEAQAKLKELEE